MKVILLTVGRTDAGFWNDATEEYAGRLKHYLTFETVAVPDVKNAKNLTEEQHKEQEGRLILNALQAGDYVVLLDERGKEMTSMQFAQFLEKKLHIVQKRLIFVVGGAFGFSEAVYQRADGQLSMSRMTFSHPMIRAVFTEQLYRAMTILRGEKYHHGG
ncbi:MAG: 23S rRNA (pseudouridine(1915)-N(3))-methyltransferase RlmH [Tannerella sp.]|nr:23S rRNA (pseudouridine(1915)-N(3))-methyltransferase RlmH [Tannerella sp.]